ncbi:RecF/RecN/SMC domain containing protein [Rhizophagus clarus]|uniref:RecF/RecN/SMC domain containing protein n=1 Tax=Rhizophagus clarus TaxID=94130 RepID=A0A8H3MC68_9GLOM|nr:RecF/RecN/SMC domain containing protein [Rhizophagus clarus]
MTSQSKYCNDGPILEELLLSGCLVENDSIQLQTLYEEPLETTRHNPCKRPRSATPESNDRLQISDSITQNVKLAQGSTGNAKVLLLFWNEYTREESKKWWLPERTDCVISDSSLWDKSLKKMGLNSWYSVRMSAPKVVKPSNSPSRFLWQDIMEYIQPPTAEEDKLPKSKSSKIPAGKAQRIRLFPTQEEQLKLRRWIGTAHWTYNQCLFVVKKEGVNRNKKDLQARCFNTVNFRNNAELKWVLETPYDI